MINTSIVNNKITLEYLQDWLIGQVAERLDMDKEDIDIDEPFDSYDLDSAQAMILIGRLEKLLDRKINPVLLFNYPNIAELSQRLMTV